MLFPSDSREIERESANFFLPCQCEIQKLMYVECVRIILFRADMRCNVCICALVAKFFMCVYILLWLYTTNQATTITSRPAGGFALNAETWLELKQRFYFVKH